MVLSKNKHGMHYQEKVDQIFARGSLWSQRTLRTLFDPNSSEYLQTSMNQKLQILNKIRKSGIDLVELIAEYKEFYLEENKPHVAKAADDGLKILLHHEQEK